MKFIVSSIVLLGLSSVTLAAPQKFSERQNQDNQRGRGRGRGGGNNNNNGNNDNNGGNGNGNQQGGQLCLSANNIQEASSKSGQEDGTKGVKNGQAESATDSANFINFCSGETLTNGNQVNGGSCNGIPMGKIPSVQNMVSSMIVNPAHADRVPSDTTFNITVQTQNFQAGAFTNPDVTYYAAPQNLNNQGDIIGHCHVTVQKIGDSARNFDGQSPPDPTDFAFFKGIDDAGNGQGLLSASIVDGLPAGFYRVCTLISSSNHQPVLMPVAQRGAQDDCTKFEVFESGNQANNDAEDAEEDAQAGNDKNNDDSDKGGRGGQGGNGNGNGGGRGNGGNGNSRPDTNNNIATPSAGGPPFSNSTATPTPVSPSAAILTQLATITEAAPNLETGTGGSSEVIKVLSGTLGGEAPLIQASGNQKRPFSVNGKEFGTAFDAVERSCKLQFKACKTAVEEGNLPGSTVDDCREQRRNCGAETDLVGAARRRAVSAML